jgi:hypothetical protein
MTAPRRPERALGDGLAAILRVGTIVAVLTIAVGFIVASMTGLPSRGGRPLLNVVLGAGPDAPIAVGLLVLTFLPTVVIGFAAWHFERVGERWRAVMAVGVLLLLLAGLVLASIIGGAS